jgi:hypothetical protein
MAFPEGLIGYGLVALASVLAPAVFGFALVRWLGLGPVHGLRFAWGVGYLIGHYVLAQVTLLWLIAGKPVSGWLLPVAAVVAAGILLRRAHRKHVAALPRVPSHWTEWLPVVLVSCVLLHAFLVANIVPVRYGDEAVNWASKAKVLYTTPGLDLSTGLNLFVSHPDYPIFNPLTQVLAFASAGRVLHFENRLPIQFFAIALLLMLSAATTRRSHALPSGLALLAFVGTSFFWLAPTAYADILLACATLAACEALLRWRETREPVFFGLGLLAMSAMVSAKNDGRLLLIALAAPFVLDLLVARVKAGNWGALARLRWRSLGWLLVPIAAVLFQRGMNAWFMVRNELEIEAYTHGRGMLEIILSQLAANGPVVLASYGRMLVDPALNSLLPLTFLLAGPLAWIARGRDWWAGAGAMTWLVFVAATIGYMLVFVGTLFDLKWHMMVAADRIMQHVLPLAVVGLTTSVWPRAIRSVV